MRRIYPPTESPWSSPSGQKAGRTPGSSACDEQRSPVLNGIVSKIINSLQHLREKNFLALQYMVTNVIGNMILVKSMAIMGLAISSSIAIHLHLFLSLIVLYFFCNGLRIGRYIFNIGRAYLMTLSFLVDFFISGSG